MSLCGSMEKSRSMTRFARPVLCSSSCISVFGNSSPLKFTMPSKLLFFSVLCFKSVSLVPSDIPAVPEMYCLLMSPEMFRSVFKNNCPNTLLPEYQESFNTANRSATKRISNTGNQALNSILPFTASSPSPGPVTIRSSTRNWFFSISKCVSPIL